MSNTKKRPISIPEFFRPEDPNVYVIHCTTSSFDEHPVRITSICIRRTKTRQERAFVPEYPPVSPTDLDIWEKEILTEFQEFMRSHPRIRWIHWSMTDDKFGWPLIQRRSAEHQITDYTDGLIDLNLNHFLEQKYGNNYEKHGHLYNLIRRNGFNHPEILGGKEEAKLANELNKASIAKLLNSCKAKTDVIQEILQAEEDRNLKTNPFTKEALFRKFAAVKTPVVFLAGCLAQYLCGLLLQQIYQYITKAHP
jgi:hypothetical protein